MIFLFLLFIYFFDKTKEAKLLRCKLRRFVLRSTTPAWHICPCSILWDHTAAPRPLFSSSLHLNHHSPARAENFRKTTCDLSISSRMWLPTLETAMMQPHMQTIRPVSQQFTNSLRAQLTQNGRHSNKYNAAIQQCKKPSTSLFCHNKSWNEWEEHERDDDDVNGCTSTEHDCTNCQAWLQ